MAGAATIRLANTKLAHVGRLFKLYSWQTFGVRSGSVLAAGASGRHVASLIMAATHDAMFYFYGSGLTSRWSVVDSQEDIVC